ncbi:MAG: hypothetical protein LC714_03280 [Actinobacteria bacterium]|nr:hypothetical protein [Actinomycetota bacterium]
MNYGDLLSEAFRITWRNRFLWFFGFFAAGGGGTFSNFFNVPSNFSGRGDLSGATQWIENNLVTILVVVGVLALALALIFIVLSFISSGGLADSVAAIDRGEQRSFSSTWRAGTSNFWRVLAQAIFLFLIALGLLLVVLLVAGVPIGLTFVLTESVGARVLLSVLFGLVGILLTVVLFVPLYIVGQFALRKLVVGRERIAYSIAAGYGLFRRNIGSSLLVWLIGILLSFGIGIAVLIVVLTVGLILFLPTIILAVTEYTTAAVAAGIVGGVILIPILLAITGAVGTFSHAYWTLAYLRLDERPGPGTEPAHEARAA